MKITTILDYRFFRLRFVGASTSSTVQPHTSDTARPQILRASDLKIPMINQYAREIEQLRTKAIRRQRDLERTSKENRERYEELQKEVRDYKDKVGRSKLKEGLYYQYKRACPKCRNEYVDNDMSSLWHCAACRRGFCGRQDGRWPCCHMIVDC